MQRFANDSIDAAVSAQTGAYQRAVTIRATKADQLVEFSPTGGRLSCDSRSPFAWSGSLALSLQDETLYPLTPNDLLTPFGTKIEAFMSVTNHLNQTSTIPFGVFFVAGSNASRGSAISVNLTLHDPAYRVARHRYESPTTYPSSLDLAELAATIVADRDPTSNTNLQPVGETLGTRTTFGLSPQVDPWKELSDTLAARGFMIMFDRTGQLTINQINPGLSSIEKVPATHVTTSFTGEDSPNVIVARGTNPNAPAFGVWENNNPSSPTFVGGPYGRVVEYFASPLLETNGQAEAAARTIGTGKAAAAATWQATFPFDPRWDPGDGMELDSPINQVLQADAINVDLAGQTTIQAHPWGGTEE